MTHEPSSPSAPKRSPSAPGADRSNDLTLIGEVVAALEGAQRARDPGGFMRLLTADAVWVTAFGKTLTGWADISAFTHSVLTPALGDQHATYKVAHVTFLGDAVAAVNVHQTPIRNDGAPDVSQPEGRPLYVMTKTGETWRIAVAQNTQVQRDAIAAQAKAVGGHE